MRLTLCLVALRQAILALADVPLFLPVVRAVRLLPVKRVAIRLAIFAAAVGLLASESALAGNYNGYGQTGFVHDRKRDCCEDALLLAADDSARSCERAGGTPDYDPRRIRGVCDADWHQGSGGALRFSCRASVTVRCR